MLALPSRFEVGSAIGTTGRRWCRWITSQWGQTELASCNAGELERLSRDLGISAADLREVASHGSDENDLLLRRMTVLHLDPVQFGRAEPAAFRDMRRVCTLCGSKGRCARELADGSDPAWQDWREYCPNATMLSMFHTLNECSSVIRQ